MPRIRTFIWIGFWAWILYIPAWIFATWYIGWDIFYLFSEGNDSGTNIVAHVSGALTGYYLGRWWLADRKWLVETELQEEIENMKTSRRDWFGISAVIDVNNRQRHRAILKSRFDQVVRRGI